MGCQKQKKPRKRHTHALLQIHFQGPDVFTTNWIMYSTSWPQKEASEASETSVTFCHTKMQQTLQ